MTGYDPFSFGQLPSREKGAAPAPDDLLFSAPAAGKASTAAADPDWSLPPEASGSAFRETGGGHDAVAFGADLLGENGTEAAPKETAGVKLARPAAGRLRTPTLGSPRAEARGQAPSPMSGMSPPRPAAPLPGRRGTTAAGVVVPIAIVAAGGTAASWFHLMQQNPVMAVLVGATSVLGAALAWVSMRR